MSNSKANGSPEKTIAIIPAKQSSVRCKNKNTRSFYGAPLWLHSVNYALSEGITPVVSTDSLQIMQECSLRGICHTQETVDDSKMENCVKQVLAQTACDIFAILQPTSPLRQKGLLSRMIEDISNHKADSTLTVQSMKLIGFLDGKFQIAHREQDSCRFFNFFDGNISACRKSFFESTDYFFDDQSLYYENEQPCSLQIDTELDFALLEHICWAPLAKEYIHL